MEKIKIVEELIGKMSVEEKVAQTMIVSYSNMTKDEAKSWAELGVGAFLHVLGDNARELKKVAMNSKNKIPLIFGIDAIHGHALNDQATVFPTQLSMACSFNPQLIKQMASATAREVSADALNWTFSPVLCLGRDLRWGRVAETFGEDKYLAGELGVAMVTGYEGDNLADNGSILSCAKHYIGYGEATGGRDSYDTEITERKMRDCFLEPFEKAVNAGCSTIMTAYGSLDGTPCTTHKRLLREILKDELNFNGYVVSDWDNVGHLIDNHCVADNYEDASRMALEGGNDMMMSTPAYYENAIKVVKEGKIPMEILDEAVRRVLNIKVKLGLFDNPLKEEDRSVIGCDKHLEINRKLTEECVVLLKNEDILPLKEDVKKIAVIGANADDIRPQYGDWTYFTHPAPHQDATPIRPYTTLLEGVKEIADKKGIIVNYAKGVDVLSEDLSGIAGAVKIAEDSDVIIFACGDVFETTGEGKDMADLLLSKSQRALFDSLVKTGKPIILVLVASKPLCIADEVKESKAVLTCFNGGQYGGEVLAKSIFGELNPSGKLPISFPYHVGQQPCYYNDLPGWHCWNYVDMPHGPLFAFGEGLSYSKFEYSDATFDKDKLELKVTVKNASDIDGKEIVQVYFRDPVSSVMTPLKQMIGFRKIDLKAGEEQTLTFNFTLKDFSFVNAKCERVTEKGKFEIMVGGSSRYEDLTILDFYL